MTPESIRFLHTPQGAELLAEAALLPADLITRLTRLRKRWPSELAAAAVETVELRKRAAGRFTQADRMLFTPVGLEQATGESAARWRAARFPRGATIVDLCCGVGGDAVALAARGKVLAIDRNPAHAICAAANAEAYGVGDSVAVACADVGRLNLRGDAAFLDPSRRAEGRRVRNPEDYSPLLSFAEEVRRAIPDLAVKVSPALSDDALEAMGARIEFVSDRGECKEAVLWFGGIGPTARRSASILPQGVMLEADPDTPELSVSPPLAWLFEPDPAVIRAHLVAEVAARIGGRLLEPGVAYLTTDEEPKTPFGRAYRILEWLPFSLNRLRKRLREMDARVVAVKRRAAPLDPAEILPRLDSAGERPVVVVLTRISGRLTAIICDA